MQIGLNEAFGTSPARDLSYIQEFAAEAETLGFDSLWVPEHIVFFDDYDSRYPYNESGTLRLGANPGIFDPFPTLTAAAVATTSLELGTAVLLIGERNPVITAREVATVDQLSNGRFLLGVGVGWSREEYEALGVPWERRGRRCDEYIAAMKALWTTERSTFKGEFCSFENVASYPKPTREPHPPVLVGGNTTPALRRASTLGDGWFGWNLTLDELETALADLDALLKASGRSREEFVLQTGVQVEGSPDEAAEYARHCDRLGFNRLVLAAPISRRTFREQLAQYSTALRLE